MADEWEELYRKLTGGEDIELAKAEPPKFELVREVPEIKVPGLTEEQKIQQFNESPLVQTLGGIATGIVRGLTFLDVLYEKALEEEPYLKYAEPKTKTGKTIQGYTSLATKILNPISPYRLLPGSKIVSGIGKTKALAIIGKGIEKSVPAKLLPHAFRLMRNSLAGGINIPLITLADRSIKTVLDKEYEFNQALKETKGAIVPGLIAGAVMGELGYFGGKLGRGFQRAIQKKQIKREVARSILGLQKGKVADPAQVTKLYNNFVAKWDMSKQGVRAVTREYNTFLKATGRAKIKYVPGKPVPEMRVVGKPKVEPIPPPVTPAPRKAPTDLVRAKNIPTYRTVNSLSKQIAKRHVAGDTKEIFSSLANNIKNKKLDIKKFSSDMDVFAATFDNIAKVNKVEKPSSKMILNYFKENKQDWNIFKVDAKKLNDRIEHSDKPFSEIYKKQSDAQQAVEKAHNQEDKTKNLIDWMNDSITFYPEQRNDFIKYKKSKIKQRKGLWGIVSKGLDDFGNQIKMKPLKKLKIVQSGFKISPEMAKMIYPQILSGDARYREFFDRTFTEIYKDLNPQERRFYGFLTEMYYKFEKRYPDKDPFQTIMKAMEGEVQPQINPVEPNERIRYDAVYSFLKRNENKIDMQKVLDTYNTVTKPLDDTFINMTTEIMKSKEHTPPFDLDFLIPKYLEGEITEVNTAMLTGLETSGLFDDLPAVSIIPEDIKNQLNNIRVKENTFVKTLKELNLITPENRNDIMKIIREGFKIRRGFIAAQRGFNPLVMRKRTLHESTVSPKIGFAQHESQMKRRMTIERSVLEKDFSLQDPVQIYAYRYSDFFTKLEKAYLFDVIRNIFTIDIKDKAYPAMIRAAATKKGELDIAKARTAMGKETFANNYKEIVPEESPDLAGWYVERHIKDMMIDMIDNRRRVGVISKLNYWFKRRSLYKPFIIWGHNIVQQGMADPRAWLRYKDAWKEWEDKGEKFLEAERLNLFNKMIYMTDLNIEDQIAELGSGLANTPEMKKLDKAFGGEGKFVSFLKVLSADKWFNKLNKDVVWVGDGIQRLALYMTYRDHGFEPEEAVDQTQTHMAGYDQMPVRTRRIFSYGVKFINYRIQMLRLLSKLITAPQKYWKAIVAIAIAEWAAFGIFSFFGYKPMKSPLTKKLGLKGVPATIADVHFNYRYIKVIEDEEGKPTGESKIITISQPYEEFNKLINRTPGTTFKLNAADLLGIWQQLEENRSLDNKRIMDVDWDELIHGLNVGVYGKKELADHIEQKTWFVLNTVYPPLREGRDWKDVITGKSGLKVAEQLVNSLGLAYVYTLTRDVNKIAQEMKDEIAKYKEKTPRWKQLDFELIKAKAMREAAILVKEGTIDLDDARRLVYLQYKAKRKKASDPEIAELLGLVIANGTTEQKALAKHALEILRGGVKE